MQIYDPCGSIGLTLISRIQSKRVLLYDRKRHRARGVASPVLDRGRGYHYPVMAGRRGYPYLVLDRTGDRTRGNSLPWERIWEPRQGKGTWNQRPGDNRTSPPPTPPPPPPPRKRPETRDQGGTWNQRSLCLHVCRTLKVKAIEPHHIRPSIGHSRH